MNFRDFYQTLEKNKFYVFSFQEIFAIFPEANDLNWKKTIDRWRKKGWIANIKRGLYELTYPKDFQIPDLYIANKLYSPSYVSLETALSYYSIIPEVAMAVTSITTKPTRRFRNHHGLFTYRSVQPEMFTGYDVEKYRGVDFFMAEPEKAFIDYIYFHAYRNKFFHFSGERFDKDKLTKLKKKKLNAYAKGYRLKLKDIYADI